MNVVWLKRDVRLNDHQPLSLAASEKLPCVVLYIYEPDILSSDSYHESHHRFINEGLVELDSKLQAIAVNGKGGKGGITLCRGHAVDVLEELHSRHRICTLFSHHEVGNSISLQRNEKVAAWAQSAGVVWIQCRQDGVSDQRRELLNEGSWANKWTQFMSQIQHPAPHRLLFACSNISTCGILNDAPSCGVAHCGIRPSAQIGGETAANCALASFLDRRGEGYFEELSSPLTGWDSCSRLSPYISWGHISLRTVFQALNARQEEIRGLKKQGCETGRWLKSLSALGSRLRWRSHFIQKLSDQPSIEHENMCRAFDAIRTEQHEDRLVAWANGRTGYPMVDACMRSLIHSGWLNFRMRAMLVSFACYDLWLDWRPLAPILARYFLDYEPGIHYPQLQMQAGTTGINANRIYNATKQAEDHAGPDFIFIRRWVPELSRVPSRYISEPHTMTLEMQRQSGCIIGVDYPNPIVDRADSYRHARSEFAKVRGLSVTKAESAKVYERHGSRKRSVIAKSGTKSNKRHRFSSSDDASAELSSVNSNSTLVFRKAVSSPPHSSDIPPLKRQQKVESSVKSSCEPSIKSYFLQSSDSFVETSMPAACTGASASAPLRLKHNPSKGSALGIRKFFRTTVSNFTSTDRSREIITIDD